MKIILNDGTNLLSEYYIQTLATLFLPCERFSADDSGEKRAICDVKIENGELICNVLLSINEKSHDGTNREAVTNSLDKLTVKRVFGIAFLNAAKSMFGFLPPWGIQTGIRPAKVVGSLLDKGFSKEKVIDYMRDKYLTRPDKTELCEIIADNERQAVGKTQKNDFSLYISIPFCPTRCNYCSFVSYTTPRLLSLIPEYVERLISEIKLLSVFVKKRDLNLKTIYFGGGTPTTLDAPLIESLIDCIKQSFDLSNLSEFTFEAGRPDTVTIEKLETLKSCGVDRLSINTQTANNEVLKNIGRTHTFEDYESAMRLAKTFGFKSINTDVIAGLPGESEESFKDGLVKIIENHPENITVHSFTVKRSSSFKEEFMKNSVMCESIYNMIDFSQSELLKNEYLPYYIYRQKNTAGNAENVGYAKSGCVGLYNIYIMEEYHTIFALGAGAVTKLVSPDRQTIERIFSPKYPYEFLDKNKYRGFDDDSAAKFYDKYFD